jgi:hypothetical protein
MTPPVRAVGKVITGRLIGLKTLLYCPARQAIIKAGSLPSAGLAKIGLVSITVPASTSRHAAHRGGISSRQQMASSEKLIVIKHIYV